MKKFVAVSLLAMMFFAGMPVWAQQNAAPKDGEWFCPVGRGHGRMAGQTPGVCPRGTGPMCMKAGSGEPLTREDAARLLERYVARTGMANLKAGDIVDNGSVFEATVLTKDGALVERLEIDKNSGFFRRAS
ncbi:MAG: hypothetical protein LLG06_02740 [Desulfobacteraceae bacterium]|nr:hypothetical protein [Desulfobacteraceae bacterium]